MSEYALRISNDEKELWQWDTSQTVDVIGEIEQVHFALKGHESAYVVDVDDGVAAIPDRLLTHTGYLCAYAYTPNHTLLAEEWVINPRPVPQTYPYTPDMDDPGTVQEALDALDARIDDTNDDLAALVDSTLAVSGKAADAAKTGEELSNLKSDLSYTKDVFGLEVVETPGYYNSSYEIVEPSVTQAEVYTQKFSTKNGMSYKVHLHYNRSSISGGMWGVYVLFDSNGAPISRNGFVNALTNDFTTTITITKADAAYIAFSYRTYNVHTIKITSNYVAEIKDLPIVTELPINETSGYFGEGGHIIAEVTSRQDVYTQKYPAYNGMVLSFLLEYTTERAMYANYVLYDANGGVLAKADVVNEMATSKSVDITITQGSVGYIAFSYRTYGEHAIRIVCHNLWPMIAAGWNYLSSLVGFQNYAVNENINSINHRGYNHFAPENTLPAYIESRRQGFRMVECDVAFTSDDIPVLLHDSTINRTARNADGTELSDTIAINDITYVQALQYDFGIWKSPQWAGTKIPSFEEFVSLCRNIGLHPYVEIKAGASSQTNVNTLVDIAKNNGMAQNITWISFSATALQYVVARNPRARIGLVVNTVNEGVIQTAQNLKNQTNDVFIDSGSHTDAEVLLCQNADIPLEVWNFATAEAIIGLPSYVSGITSDNLVAGYVTFQNCL